MGKYLHFLWIALVCISLGIAVWFSGIAVKKGWEYVKLNTSTSAVAIEWGVKKISTSKYALVGEYEYTVKNTLYKGKTVLQSPRFLNPFSAEREKKNCPLKTWTVWYSQSNPNIASLEKRFPQKQVMHALLTLGVFAYFCCARRIVAASNPK